MAIPKGSMHMKRKLLVTLVVVLSCLMVGSVFMTALSMATGISGNLFSGTRNYDRLAEEAPAFNTTTPSYWLDFTTKDISENYGMQNHVTWSCNTEEGYTTFTATENDPHIYFNSAPSVKGNQMKYMAVCYRTDINVKAELFATRPSAPNMGPSSTNLQWDTTGTGEWVIEVIHCTPWAEADENFTNFRIDPMQQPADRTIVAGDAIDYKYMAFFATEEDATGFNLDEYKAKLAWEEEQKRLEEEENKKTNWPDPTYKEMETVSQDMNIGTLTYTPSEDGTEMTISYKVAGETVSYTVPNSANYLSGGFAATDDLDRTLYTSDEIGSYKGDERYVGLFYFLWQGEHGDTGVFDLQKIIDEEGIEAAGSTACGRYGACGQMHWFAEPLYGYYYANDAWVLRKHAELLTNANIDFLYFDVTNSYTYSGSALKLMEILSELNAQGYDAPQVVFYTNSSAASTVNNLYNTIYKPGEYEDTWFRIDGKPVIIAPEDVTLSDGKKITDFYTVKANQWPNEASKTNGWPWMDFDWPQRVFYDKEGKDGAINVSIAQHSGNVQFSTSSLYNSFTNRGRSFNNTNGSTDAYNGENFSTSFRKMLRSSYNAWRSMPELSNYGLNFQSQFDHAIASDAKYILVTGWNEWVAQRQPNASGKDDGIIRFVDTASIEFSRDAEMMRGGYFDNYYIQLIYNVQRVKGTAPIVVQDSRKPINVTGEFDQWDDVLVTYQDPTGDTVDRNGQAFGRQTMTNTTGRNDFVTAKMTSDTKNLYFYTSLKYDVTMFDTQSSWMQVYVNSDSDGSTGWYGYDYIVNYQAKDHFTTTVAKYNGTDGDYSFVSVGEVAYRAKGNQMMIAVPLEMLGIDNYEEIAIEFKWADGKTLYDEMEDFYCDGDMAPLGRLNYIYQNYIPVDVSETDPETTPATEPETDPITEPETQPDTTADTAPESGVETAPVTTPGTTLESDPATEPETQAATEPVTTPATGAVDESEASTAGATDGHTETDATDADGCASIVTSAAVLALVTLAGAAVALRRKDG